MDIQIEIRCPFCGTTHFVTADFNAYCAWQAGELIQRAMPDLTPTQREQLISGICPKCQADVFGVDENEDFEPADIDSDLGFDPYVGCFTDDC